MTPETQETIQGTTVDASRRTRLANERTYLAWWRTALASFAVSLGAGQLLPSLTGSQGGIVFEALGIGFGLIGMLCIGYALQRYLAVEKAIDHGTFVAPSKALTVALTVVGLALGVLVLVAILG